MHTVGSIESISQRFLHVRVEYVSFESHVVQVDF